MTAPKRHALELKRHMALALEVCRPSVR